MTFNRSLLFALLTGLLLAFSVSMAFAEPDQAKGKAKGHDKQTQVDHSPNGNGEMDKDEPWLQVIFTDAERKVFRDYYRNHPPGQHAKPLPPGLQKKVARGGELPPGWQKKVARGEVLGYDILSHGRGLPDDLLGRLPPQPDGTVLVEISGKVVRLIEATRTIVDVLDL